MSTQNVETEIKLRWNDSPHRARALLRSAGFRIIRRRVFEVNLVFDSPDLKLRAARELIRLRTAGQAYTLTYKGPPQPGPHKSREEIETQVTNPVHAEVILTKLGYHPVFRYEKFRTEYQDYDGEGTITLDETPIGIFFEIEGPSEWIDRTATRLGFSSPDFILQSYGSLYLDYCRQHGLQPKNMVFPLES